MSSIVLQENKTKGDVRPEQIQRQLTFDLQTMLYLVALEEYRKSAGWDKDTLSGILYNVIRRPLSGGKGSIVRHKATKNQPEETHEHFYARLGEIIREDSTNFFMRWTVEITPRDIAKFRRECLDPILEQLCDWWQHVEWSVADRTEGDLFGVGPSGAMHWRHPFGVYNILDEGGSSDVDGYLETGSEVGLRRIDNLFPELV